VPQLDLDQQSTTSLIFEPTGKSQNEKAQDEPADCEMLHQSLVQKPQLDLYQHSTTSLIFEPTEISQNEKAQDEPADHETSH